MNTGCDQLRARVRVHEQLPPGQAAVQEVTWVESRAPAVLVEQTGVQGPRRGLRAPRGAPVHLGTSRPSSPGIESVCTERKFGVSPYLFLACIPSTPDTSCFYGLSLTG